MAPTTDAQPTERDADGWRRDLRPVTRTRDEARAAYDRASRWYDLLEDPLERRPRWTGLGLLSARSGERVLEVGCGPGTALVELGRAVGPSGRVAGVDLSPAMVGRAAARLAHAGMSEHVVVRVADALRLPWPDGSFDALFAAFVLELFDTPEIPAALGEWRRVLRGEGRIVVVSLSRAAPVGWPTRLYERLHDRFPAALDCRPIHTGLALEAAGFVVEQRVLVPLFGLRSEAVLARPGRG
jgi:demethylmenaquinone methyltransferase/2-methoxy-6-polyprenyl-1,4-benzoquinol methylase